MSTFCCSSVVNKNVFMFISTCIVHFAKTVKSNISHKQATLVACNFYKGFLFSSSVLHWGFVFLVEEKMWWNESANERDGKDQVNYTKGMLMQKHKQKHKQSTCMRRHRQGQRWTVLMNMHKKTHTPWYSHTQTHLPCVSVDWVNQPNFPFFFSVRSASVTPWCYQHAVHTARQQRKQWVNTQQNKRERNVRQETAAIQTTDTVTMPRTATKCHVMSSFCNKLAA